jgi:ATP phosphoribosyltransferase
MTQGYVWPRPFSPVASILLLELEEWVAVRAMVEKKDVARIMDELVNVSAEDILILKIDNCQ